MSRKDKMKIYHGIPTPPYVNKGESVHIDFSNGYYGKGVSQIIDRRSTLGGNKTAMTLIDGISGMSAKFTKSTTGSSYEHSVLLNETFYFDEGVSISAIVKTKDVEAYFNGLYLVNITDPSKPLTAPNTATVYRFLGLGNVVGSPKDRLSLCAYKDNLVVPNKVVTIDIATDTYVQFQFIVKDMIAYCYINGDLLVKQDMSTFKMDVTKFNCINFLFPVNVNGEFYIENLVISRDTTVIPNFMPDDYSKGKAIMKERLNQQQIKGDPLISQTSTVVAGFRDNYGNAANSDGFWTKVKNPELSVTSSDWASGVKIKLKGINGGVIGGIIDSDTALGKVIKVNKLQSNAAEVFLDNISGLSNGDKINFCDPNNITGNSWGVNNVYGIVSELNPYNNSCTVASYGANLTPAVGDLFFEVTESSSSPTVKTTDGIAVVGTWTGLGTNEAIFTLGTNSSLLNKDLLITYSLNMPSGNSHFPELPHTIERAYTETGIEMKPVNEILITDDFSGKINGDLNSCPYVSKFHNSTVLVKPTESWAGELKSNEYAMISSSDGLTVPVSNQLANHYAQQIFEFDLIKLVESKMGEIPSVDKVAWLRSNYSSVTVSYTGYGSSASTSNMIVTLFNHTTNQWMDTWLSIIGATSPKTVSGIFSTDSHFGNLLPQGKLYVLAYAGKSDGVTPSIINTDYIKVDLRLKMDATFTTLYCDNKRAREGQCNPVLIQKQTKTVKRYMPSKECFVTECNYFNPKHEVKGVNILKEVTGTLNSEKGCTLMTYGTGGYIDYGNNNINGSIARLKPLKPSHLYTGEILSYNNSFANGTIACRYASNQGNGVSYEDNFGEVLVDTDEYSANNMLLIRSKLINDNGEAKLAMYMSDIINKKFAGETLKVYSLPNKPLIK